MARFGFSRVNCRRRVHQQNVASLESLEAHAPRDEVGGCADGAPANAGRLARSAALRTSSHKTNFVGEKLLF